MFGTIEAAIDYIQGKLADFYNRRFEVQSLYDQARINLQDAYAKGMLITEATSSLAETIQMVDDYYELSDKLKPLASAFNIETGLGVFPAIVWTAIYALGGVTAAITVAELLYGYYQRIDSQRVVIKAVKDGLLDPSILTKPPAPGTLDKITNIMFLALIGLGGYLFMTKKV